jgi:hypothetical protein
MGQERKGYKVLVGKPKGKKPLGTLRYRWYYGIRMDFRKLGCVVVGWIQLSRDRNR